MVPLAGNGDGPAHLAQDIEEKWDETHSDVQWPSLEFGLKLCQASPDADSNHGVWLGRHIFDASNPQRTPEWTDENLDLMPEEFRAGFLARLVEGLAGVGDDVPHYLRVAAEVGDQERQALLTSAAQEAVQSGTYGVAENLLGELSDEDAAPLVEKVAERLVGEPRVAIDAGGMELVVERQEVLGAEGVEELVERLIDLLIERRVLAPRMGPPLGKLRVKSAERRLSLVQRLINFEADVQNVARREGILKGANGLAGRASSNARKAIDERLDRMRSAGGAEEELAERVAAES